MGRGAWLALTAAIALILCGCTAGSRSEDSAGPVVESSRATETPTATPLGDPDRLLTFAVVTHGTAGDSFWDVVKTGAEDAGAADNIEIDYQADPEPGGQAQLIDAATSSQVDGLIVSMPDPDALQESIARAEAAGIPVVTIDAGEERSAEFGALTHVGQSAASVGEGAGVRLREAGVTKLLCVIHEAGNVSLEERCQGAALGLGANPSGGDVEDVMHTMRVNASNIAVTETTIASELRTDPEIDGVLTLNPAVADAAAAAIEAAGSAAMLATFDLNADVFQSIRNGQILFAVDQQQYLQGYLPVVFLALYARNGNVVGGGQPVPTGPRYITVENVDSVEDLASNGTR
ncbi:MAG: substrate-binding domain-containing protein [Geodermatophilaceae bacterium]|nr:substrate-binding domain-containing protein [Geodermatophilaceae bacterium]